MSPTTLNRSQSVAGHLDDREFLRLSTSPGYEPREKAVRLVDLFCGCGGLTLGLAEAARRLGFGVDVRLAVDVDECAVMTYEANFPLGEVLLADVGFFFDGRGQSEVTEVEAAVQELVGPVDFLIGGPPCQGHSDLNNHTRRADERNGLYRLMARAAFVLRPEVVIVENVPSVKHDTHDVVAATVGDLSAAGYRVAETVVTLSHLGVPQRRRRHVMLAVRGGRGDPATVLQNLARTAEQHDLHWAIGDLTTSLQLDPLHTPSAVASSNRDRIAWLFENDAFDLPDELRPKCHREKKHTYRSVYGRLSWDQPAQTITSGFTSMGQGRFVHPSEPRTLTPREAARIQFFPDFFDFAVVSRRSAWSEMIGNAVPPKLTMSLGALLIPTLGLAENARS